MPNTPQIPDTIQPYIDLGMHTVPIAYVKRNEDGTKKVNFPKVKPGYYQDNLNDIPAPAGTVFTGEKSNFTVLDFDDVELFHMAKQLDPDCNYVVKSDIEAKGGHMGYLYEPSIPSKRVRGKLDTLNEGSQVFVVAKGNETKIPERMELDELTKMPDSIKSLVNIVLESANKPDTSKPKDFKGTINVGMHIAPVLEGAIKSKEYSPLLFRIITPKEFRTNTYLSNGHLHPNDVPDGEGSAYLSQVAAILASDVSVSPELFEKAMEYINNMWDEPMDRKRLRATIIKRMVAGEATDNEGNPFWKYDEYWQEQGVRGTTKDRDSFEVVYDPDRVTYYFINYTQAETRGFDKPNALTYHLASLAGRAIKLKDLTERSELCRVRLEPSMPYGKYRDGEKVYFNKFKPTDFMEVLKHPESYTEYKEPIHTIKFLETLIPNEDTRTMFLAFLKRKLTTFEYSPMVVLLMGKQGTGKNLLFDDIITRIVGPSYVINPRVQEFIEKHNGWLMDKLFIHLEEYGEQAKSHNEKREIKANLKKYTGTSTISIRKMGADSFPYPMLGTFFMSANEFPLVLDPEDRRVFVINTDNPLTQQKWIQDLGGTGELKNMIALELMDFCYWLGNEIEDMDDRDYQTPPNNSDKLEMLIHTAPIPNVITHLLGRKMFGRLHKFFTEEHNVSIDVFKYSHRGFFRADDLGEAYEEITGNSTKILEAAMRAEGFRKKFTSVNNEPNVPIYEVSGLSKFVKPTQTEEMSTQIDL